MLKPFSFDVPGLQGERGFKVIRADSEELADFVYRFRYHVYVEQMKRRQIYADHARGVIREPMDERGDNYIAVKEGAVIGTIRRNRLDDPATAYYSKFYRGELFHGGRPDRVAITTKLMMLPQFRQTSYPIKLITAYAQAGYRAGVEVELLDCNKPLVSFFERMGYFSYRGWAFHKEFGTVRPMFFAADTLAYLKVIGSFLHAAGKDVVRDGQYGGYELVASLANEPWIESIREASAPFRRPCRA